MNEYNNYKNKYNNFKKQSGGIISNDNVKVNQSNEKIPDENVEKNPSNEDKGEYYGKITFYIFLVIYFVGLFVMIGYGAYMVYTSNTHIEIYDHYNKITVTRNDNGKYSYTLNNSDLAPFTGSSSNDLYYFINPQNSTEIVGSNKMGSMDSEKNNKYIGYTLIGLGIVLIVCNGVCFYHL